MTLERKMDRLGRIGIPSKVSKKLGFLENQELEITIEYGEICIKKFQREDVQKKQYVGIVRKMDPVNRVCIPREYLDVLKIEPGNDVCLTVEDGIIRFR